MLHLVGDVGGTNTRLAIYESTGQDAYRLVRMERYPSKQFSCLGEIVKIFLAGDRGRIRDACIGVPGPVVDGTVTTTNLPWHMSETELADALEIPRVRLANDLATVAAAIPLLTKEDLVTLHDPTPPKGAYVRAVVAPGTGLGQAAVVEIDGKQHVLSSEGGHVNFSPTTQLEFEFVEFLLRKLRIDRVSVERLLSGPGLVNIYTFLRDTARYEENEGVGNLFDGNAIEQARVISEAALRDKDALALAALDLFLETLGRHAGNVMLTYMASAGIYIAGGIAPKILPRILDLQQSIVKAYTTKGRLSPVIEATPLHVIKDDLAGLRGAAYIASCLS